ncbi:hypothetical protein LY90DRAFT_506340 [Neocallimastix californiae]|uniref:Uncharacterized protein n=1 Tax=Neocallimastix californiae TaxID=1754190 RepID=A0A1Y2DF85_9FUNG|nr:hypothetical protein LY90DRAFT_506340 [Neocallimastix californiae]|eukprot:ORY57940.1 hypothetical protein LY90DRAFT_506340 [Neocallimastix californiae]
MTTNNYFLNPEERLNKSNFEDWYPTVSSILKSKKLLDYISSDVLTTMANDVRNGTKTQQDLEDAKVKDSVVRAFILTSITKEVKKKIRNSKTAYNIMAKIKEHYDKSKSNDVDHYIRKLNSLKSKNIDDSLEVISEIIDIFEILDEKNYRLGTLEKAKYINFAVPTEIRLRLPLKHDMDIDDFVSNVKEQINVLQYFLGKTTGKETKSNKIDDFMDIDYHVREQRRISTLNHCRKSNKKDNSRKYISNVELSEDYSSDVDTKENTCFDEIKPLFKKQVCNIESTT